MIFLGAEATPPSPTADEREPLHSSTPIAGSSSVPVHVPVTSSIAFTPPVVSTADSASTLGGFDVPLTQSIVGPSSRDADKTGGVSAHVGETVCPLPNEETLQVAETTPSCGAAGSSPFPGFLGGFEKARAESSKKRASQKGNGLLLSYIVYTLEFANPTFYIGFMIMYLVPKELSAVLPFKRRRQVHVSTADLQVSQFTVSGNVEFFVFKFVVAVVAVVGCIHFVDSNNDDLGEVSVERALQEVSGVSDMDTTGLAHPSIGPFLASTCGLSVTWYCCSTFGIRHIVEVILHCFVFVSRDARFSIPHGDKFRCRSVTCPSCQEVQQSPPLAKRYGGRSSGVQSFRQWIEQWIFVPLPLYDLSARRINAVSGFEGICPPFRIR